MAVTRRGYIFAAFLSSIVSVLLIIVAVASDNWVVSTASAVGQAEDSNFSYGLFRGELVFRLLATPTINTLYMTCLPDENACAVSCKTEAQARQDEVRALAQGFRPNEACISVTDVSTENPLERPPVISFALYVSVLVVLFLQLLFSVLAAILGVINATRNPTEPLCGLPGCLWSNVISSVLGLTALLTFGVYWAVSGLKEHLAFSYIALGQFQPDPSLGYSYWLLVLAVVCSLTNVCFIEMRRYLLERDPPPPTIKVENHSDGTIFLY